ncbi:toll/interleukin-1 receptor domain-containing protein [Accumulibacter sp.]|uniref:toll/interleukin-1 receptor domain-containing protein n=1 Tax=Accumulibacter sp. TaxID=2053492 RepID=UPI00260C9B67|nr:toll/interleukin-1 receptor domain-containing protein [Accumulibacter sp.]
MVSVYVSYAWKEEEENRLVEKLGEACERRGVELVRDVEEIGYGESIKAFMDQLGAADHIVVVLSDRYFLSRYCLYELREIWRHGRIGERVHPIVLGSLSSDPREWTRYVRHWQQEKEGLADELSQLDAQSADKLRQFVADYADYGAQIADWLIGFADTNCLSADIHLGQQFAALLDPIVGDFRGRVIGELRDLLERSRPLRSALEARLPASAAARARDLAAELCSGDPERTISTRLFPATRACLASLHARPSELDAAWSVAKSLVAWLSLLAVDLRSLARARRKAPPAERPAFEIVACTALGVEVFSSRYAERAPQLRADRGKSGVLGAHAIAEPVHEAGWEAGAALDELLLEIWRCVFPEESRRRLEEPDRRRLNATLRIRREQRIAHHYVLVPLEERTPLTRPEVYRGLRDKLPDIDIVFYKAEGELPVLRVSDEEYFMSIIREFLHIPEAPTSKP